MRFFRLMIQMILISLFLGMGCMQSPPVVQDRMLNPVERLHRDIHQIFETPAFVNAFWGVAIQSLTNGEYIYLRNAYKGFIPASNMKLLTTAAALLKLGEDFVYTTDIYYTGKIIGNRLDGDLIIRGSGDPTIGAHFENSNQRDAMLNIFQQWANEIKAQGIHTIEGRIIGDDNLFSDEILGLGWEWNDESDWCAAQNNALSFNDNCIDIYISPGDSIDAKCNWQIFPQTDYVEVINDVTTLTEPGNGRIRVQRDRGTNRIHLTGTIGLNRRTICDYFTIENPTLFFVTVLKDVFVHAGIDVTGAVADIDDLPDFVYPTTDSNSVFRHQSPPLCRIIPIINKNSHNLWAELLLRTLGAHFNKQGGYAESVEVVKTVLDQIGIDSQSISIADGSGLSRHNLLTPFQIITLLRYMHSNNAFIESLSIAGIDGTLKHRMQGTLAAENVRAKTGTLTRVKALSGYVKSVDAEEFVFSMVTNHYTVPVAMANNIQNLVCERLANFSRK